MPAFPAHFCLAARPPRRPSGPSWATLLQQTSVVPTRVASRGASLHSGCYRHESREPVSKLCGANHPVFSSASPRPWPRPSPEPSGAAKALSGQARKQEDFTLKFQTRKNIRFVSTYWNTTTTITSTTTTTITITSKLKHHLFISHFSLLPSLPPVL
ncbi:hypothetical protein E2C01_046633 [Portunus trituberculatus]|uniref:Uncharacterized protein n=1 Tax=Portunus trituberculatus TaxID=210409 RepID=A0A5B7G5B5_PORTR|nr:hypothetical protein [Portunus trituberculatus]